MGDEMYNGRLRRFLARRQVKVGAADGLMKSCSSRLTFTGSRHSGPCPPPSIVTSVPPVISASPAPCACGMMAGTLVTIEGGGHGPECRDPVEGNLLLHDFIKPSPFPASPWV